MTIWSRLAIAVATLLAIGAVTATLLPTSPQGASCGTWVSPEWDEEATDELVERGLDLADQSLSEDIARQGASIAANARRAQALCSDALGTRRTVTLALLGAAVAIPVALLFVGGASGRRRDEQQA